MVLKNIAISNLDDQVLNFYSPGREYGKGSFSPVYTDLPEQVKTISLDTLLIKENIAKVDFIKVDVEGYEYFVFKGAASLLQQEIAPDILFEFLDWAEDRVPGRKKGDAQKLLREYGYTLYGMVENKPVRLEEMIMERPGMIFATKKIL